MAQGHYINGAWQQGDVSKSLKSFNSVSHECVYDGFEARPDQINEAVSAARQAFKTWRLVSFEERVACCRLFIQTLKDHSYDLVSAIGRETAKPRWECELEIQTVIAKLDISILAHLERTGYRMTQTGSVKAVLQHRPHGVIALFGPYNFPAHLPNGHIMPALLAGNCIVFKPSELTPLAGEVMIQCWEKSLPKGVINLVQGSVSVGTYLAQHPQLDGLFFTGSARVGHLLHEQFAAFPEKIMALEMGGNNPLVLGAFEDNEATIYTCIQSAFLSAGQRCTCARRVFVPVGTKGDHFIEQLLGRVEKLVIGEWNAEPQPFMGALVSVAAASRVLQAQQEWKDKGAKVLKTAQILKEGTALISPGILDTTGCDIPDEEVFGPLMQIIRYENFETAINLANATHYGLSAALLSTNSKEFEYFEREIRAGVVNWNRPTTGASSHMPFGGVGKSGNLRPTAYYAADSCSYPVAGVQAETPEIPAILPPGWNS
ncbi:MAG: succinylglutamate-semialdehyde dehydrogenase [Pseudomonadota bacterium]